MEYNRKEKLLFFVFLPSLLLLAVIYVGLAIVDKFKNSTAHCMLCGVNIPKTDSLCDGCQKIYVKEKCPGDNS